MKNRFRYSCRILLAAAFITAIGGALIRLLHDSLHSQTWEIASISEVHPGGSWSGFDEYTGQPIGGPRIDYYATCTNRNRAITIQIGDSENLYGKDLPLSPGDRFWFAADRDNPDTRRNPVFIDLKHVGVLIQRRADGTKPVSRRIVNLPPTPAYE